jgi:hypothetical protein
MEKIECFCTYFLNITQKYQNDPTDCIDIGIAKKIIREEYSKFIVAHSILIHDESCAHFKPLAIGDIVEIHGHSSEIAFMKQRSFSISNRTFIYLVDKRKIIEKVAQGDYINFKKNRAFIKITSFLSCKNKTIIANGCALSMSHHDLLDIVFETADFCRLLYKNKSILLPFGRDTFSISYILKMIPYYSFFK